ncbi:helix-turn-helix domain-containing protein [Bosea beijingensis]|jgi:transcriptional regulator with XRE-family HTH domain
MEKDAAEELSRRLMSARRGKGISQEALATKTNLSPQSVSNYENARSVPSLGSLLKMAEALDTPISQLLDKLDDRRKPLRTARYQDEAAIIRLLGVLTDAQVHTVRALLETFNKQSWGATVTRARRPAKPGGSGS